MVMTHGTFCSKVCLWISVRKLSFISIQHNFTFYSYAEILYVHLIVYTNMVPFYSFLILNFTYFLCSQLKSNQVFCTELCKTHCFSTGKTNTFIRDFGYHLSKQNRTFNCTFTILKNTPTLKPQ